MATIERSDTLITLTEAAADKIKQLMAEENEVAVLRVAVQGGGCSGFEYALGFDRGSQEGDHQFTFHGVDVVVDPYSAPYLQGATIDFLNGLQESGFKIDNPNVDRGLRLRALVPGGGGRSARRHRRWLRLRLLTLEFRTS